MKRKLLTLSLFATAAILAGCAHSDGDYMYMPGANVNEKVRVPTGHIFVKAYKATGVLHYECKATGMRGDWTFSPEANLQIMGTPRMSVSTMNTAEGGGGLTVPQELEVGSASSTTGTAQSTSALKYYAGPTWESLGDGSKLIGKQVNSASNGEGNLPLQLIRVDNTRDYGKTGEMIGYSYVQRLNTSGGAAPTSPCGSFTNGQKVDVPYTADYIFYKALK